MLVTSQQVSVYIHTRVNINLFSIFNINYINMMHLSTGTSVVL